MNEFSEVQTNTVDLPKEIADLFSRAGLLDFQKDLKIDFTMSASRRVRTGKGHYDLLRGDLGDGDGKFAKKLISKMSEDRHGSLAGPSVRYDFPMPEARALVLIAEYQNSQNGNLSRFDVDVVDAIMGAVTRRLNKEDEKDVSFGKKAEVFGDKEKIRGMKEQKEAELKAERKVCALLRDHIMHKVKIVEEVKS